MKRAVDLFLKILNRKHNENKMKYLVNDKVGRLTSLASL